MGEFRLPERRLTIVLDQGEYAGAEATVRLKTVGAYWEVRRLTRPPAEGETRDEYDARLRALYELAAQDVFVAWNLADHAGPIPCTPAGFARVDHGLFGELLGYWGMATERSPFVKPSPATEPSGRRKNPKGARR